MHFTEIAKKTCHLGQKNIFLIKLSHIQLHWTNLLFWSIITEIDKKNVIRVKKVFFSAKWATYSYTQLFNCIEAILQKLKKTYHLGQ